MGIREHGLDTNDPTISINPLSGPRVSEELKKQFLELQLRMATSSINHEYARIEFDDAEDHERRDELLEYMHECRQQYQEARQALSIYDPYALADFEADLMRQKMMTLGAVTAN